MAKFYIPNFGIQKNIIKALSNYKQLNALNKGVGIEYENLMLVLGNNSNIFRTYFKEEQSGRFRDSNFSDYIKQVANQGADITISSKYGLEKTIESFKNVPNVTGFSCNNGAYVMAFDKNGQINKKVGIARESLADTIKSIAKIESETTPIMDKTIMQIIVLPQ